MIKEDLPQKVWKIIDKLTKKELMQLMFNVESSMHRYNGQPYTQVFVEGLGGEMFWSDEKDRMMARVPSMPKIKEFLS